MTTPNIHGRRNSLTAYLHRTFIPEVLAESPHWTVRKYKSAVTKLCLCVAYDITLGEVNDALMDGSICGMNSPRSIPSAMIPPSRCRQWP